MLIALYMLENHIKRRANNRNRKEEGSKHAKRDIIIIMGLKKEPLKKGAFLLFV